MQKVLTIVCGTDGQKWVDAEDLFFLLNDGGWCREVWNGVFSESEECVESCGGICRL